MQTQTKTQNPLFQYASLGKIDDTLNKLQSTAIPENWDYAKTPCQKQFPILRNYLIHTFMRIKEQGKIAEYERYSCFNTGLITPNYQEIFILFKETQDGSGRFFVEFCKESDSNLARFSKLPERATYFDDISELFYDFGLELRINIDRDDYWKDI